MAAANKFDYKHALLIASGLGSVVVESLANGQGQSVATALHISAGALAIASMILGFITHSLTSPALPPVVVAVSPTPGAPAQVVASQVQS